jgi:hypothetical protein
MAHVEPLELRQLADLPRDRRELIIADIEQPEIGQQTDLRWHLELVLVELRTLWSERIDRFVWSSVSVVAR